MARNVFIFTPVNAYNTADTVMTANKDAMVPVNSSTQTSVQTQLDLSSVSNQIVHMHIY